MLVDRSVELSLLVECDRPRLNNVNRPGEVETGQFTVTSDEGGVASEEGGVVDDAAYRASGVDQGVGGLEF